MRKAITVILLASALGGCASMNVPGSVAGSCQVFRDPGFRVRGLTSRDQRWIASTQETGIQVCHWKRPKAEPYKVDCPTVLQVVSMFNGDAARAEQYAVSQGASKAQIEQARACVQPPVPMTVISSQPPKKPSVWQRVKARFKRHKS